MGLFDRMDGTALDQRVSELETQVVRLQRLVRVLAVAFLVLTAVVLLPVILNVAGVLLMLAGAIFVVRCVADGAWGRLGAPVRVARRAFRAATAG
jgi:hypothetical protein